MNSAQSSLPHVAFIALGANLGRREETLREALKRLGARSDVVIERVSTFIETDAVGGPPGQPAYLNATVKLRTSLPPRELLNVLLALELALGRERIPGERNTPRTIDLDVLLFDDLILNEPGLELPHPRLHERAFVLKPLTEIAGEVVHPLVGRPMNALLSDLRAG